MLERRTEGGSLQEFRNAKPPNMPEEFSHKWSKIRSAKTDADEKVLFVEPGEVPVTQRQVIFYNEFLFVKRVLDHPRTSDVVELGCGRGTISLFLAAYLGKKTALLDTAPDAIEIARSEFSRRGKEAKFLVADALATGLPGGSFDACISIGLAEHFERGALQRLYREQYRILRPGGVMISLNIPKKFSIQYLNTIYRACRKWFGNYTQGIRKDYFRSNVTPREYKAIAENVGFKNVSITFTCPIPIFTPVSRETDRKLATLYRHVLKFRGWFQAYPFQTNPLLAQEHFLVGYRQP